MLDSCTKGPHHPSGLIKSLNCSEAPNYFFSSKLHFQSCLLLHIWQLRQKPKLVFEA